MAEKKSKEVMVEVKWAEVDLIIRIDLSAFKDCNTRVATFTLNGRTYFLDLQDEEAIRESRSDPIDLPNPLACVSDGL